MQNYRQKTAAASLGDRLLRIVVTAGMGIGWFVCLWGLSLPALTAGTALGGLLWLCLRQFVKANTARHEKQLRRIIGGELALKRLLLMQADTATKQVLLWTSVNFPLNIEKTDGWEITGISGGKRTLLRLIAQHESQPVTAQQVVDCARSALEKHMEQCILCLTSPISREAGEFAAQSEMPIHIISRQELIDLAGLQQPATDADLQVLAQRKRLKRTTKEWCGRILSPERTKRYFWYAVGLGLLALLTGEPFYPIPALTCLTLYAVSRMRIFLTVSHKHWKAQSTAPPKEPRREP